VVPTSVNLQLHTFSSPGYQSIVDQAVEFFGKTPVHSLPPPVNFPGVGVYAIYYFGEFECYQHLVVANRKQCRFPIYVGKAVPRGWRTGRVHTSDNEQHLYSRLREHERSIAHGAGFVAGDFRCRFVILGEMETDLISSIESRMIRKFDPLWNTTVDGFGNHDALDATTLTGNATGGIPRLTGLATTTPEAADIARPARSGMFCIPGGPGQTV